MALRWSKYSHFNFLNKVATGYLDMADEVLRHPEAFEEADCRKAANIFRSHGHATLADSIERTLQPA